MTTTTFLPAFAMIRIEEPEPGHFVACLGQNRTEQLDDLSASAMRKLASDSVPAAEWLEGTPASVLPADTPPQIVARAANSSTRY